MKRFALCMIAVLVLAPMLLLLLLATILSPLPLLTGGPAILIASTLVAGWFGAAALVRLCAHFFRSDSLPPAPGKAAAGLMVGAASALTLLGSSPGLFRYPAVLLCGPLVAAAYLGYLLWRSWRAGPEPGEYA